MVKNLSSADKPADYIFYGRRGVRGLTEGLKQIGELGYGGLGINLSSIQQQVNAKEDWLEPLFAFQPKRLWLEVGFGSGESLINLAQFYPEDGFIGAEAYRNGVIRAARDTHSAKLTNIRLFDDDARSLIQLLPDQALDGLIVLFPDPWPKRRHRLRRLIGPELIGEIKRILKPNAELRVATDHPDYLTWALSFLIGEGGFEWQANCQADWQNRPSDWFATRYEQKSLAGPPHYLKFVKT